MEMSKRDAIILADLEDEAGKVTAEKVVSAARAPDHEWHGRFEWNDSKAAARYRLDQARTLIRSIKFERKSATATVRSIAYVRDPSAAADQQAYVSVARLRTDEEGARDVLIQEFSRIASTLRRVRELARMLELEDQVASMLQQTEGLTDMLRSANRHGGAGEATPS
jgi:hypothetical protein